MIVLGQQLDSQDVGLVGHGGGFGLFGGVRLGRWVSLELNWTYTAHDESWEGGYSPDLLQIQTITGDFKLHIPTRGRIEPFVQAGAGFGFMGVNGDYYHEGYIFQSGPTFSLGGGLDLWLGPWFTLGGRVLYRGIYFGESYDVVHQGSTRRAAENFINGVTVDVNLAFHF
jgi:hypothetical protein